MSVGKSHTFSRVDEEEKEEDEENYFIIMFSPCNIFVITVLQFLGYSWGKKLSQKVDFYFGHTTNRVTFQC